MPKPKHEIRGAELTPLHPDGLRRLVRRYWKCKKPLKLWFCPEGPDFGEHSDEENYHLVRISVEQHVDAGYTGFDLIITYLETILHEFRHAWQSENWPNYHDDETRGHEALTVPHLQYRFSLVESDADSWALRHIRKAFDIHNG